MNTLFRFFLTSPTAVNGLATSTIFHVAGIGLLLVLGSWVWAASMKAPAGGVVVELVWETSEAEQQVEPKFKTPADQTRPAEKPEHVAIDELMQRWKPSIIKPLAFDPLNETQVALAITADTKIAERSERTDAIEIMLA
ncbi:MAG: hypothetical protein N2C12_18350, partial [Planctomycetales bacterium]